MNAFRVSLMLCVSAPPCAAQSSNPQAKSENVSDMKFAAFPNVPTRFTGAVEHGDPSSGPSTFIVKGTKGCEVPMHFHTPTEQVVMVSGTARMEMKGDQPRIMKAGGIRHSSSAPRPSPHLFECLRVLCLQRRGVRHPLHRW